MSRIIRQAAVAARADRSLPSLIAILTSVRALYVVSFPFLIEGDGYTYFDLLGDVHSHLLHATGYVFLFSPAGLVFALFDVDPAGFLVFAQHGLSIVSEVVLYVALRRIIPRLLAFGIVLSLGIDTQHIAAAGTTRPEFLQVILLVLAISSVVFALTATEPSRKRLFYAATGALLMAGYLTKYNFIALWILAAAPLFDKGLGWRQCAEMGARLAGAGGVLLAVFVGTFHYPTTRSFHLNLVHGWIHLSKLNAAGIPLSPDNGIATQKYLVLSHELPETGAGPGPWRKINEIPEETRRPYRDSWLPLLESTDAAHIGEVYDLTFPAGGPDPSQDPRYLEPPGFYTLYYHLGLLETEVLLGDVFQEALLRFGSVYLEHVGTEFFRGARFATAYRPYLPVPGLSEPTEGFFDQATNGLLGNRARIVRMVDNSLHPPDVLTKDIWRRGARVFSYLGWIAYLPDQVVWGLMLSGLLPVGMAIFRGRRFDPVYYIFLLSLVALPCLIGFSALVFVFRMKELILAYPLICLSCGTSASLWWSWVSVDFRR